MLILTRSEIDKKKRDLVKSYKKEIFTQLDISKDIFKTCFQNVTIKLDGQADHGKPAIEMLFKKIEEAKIWITTALERTMELPEESECEIQPFDLMNLPVNISVRLVRVMLEILTCGRDFRENDLYFISEVGNALNLPPDCLLNTIEQIEYEIRRDFFNHLLDYLDERQCFQAALLLLNAIKADDVLHPSEFKYIENINQLLRNDQARIKEVESALANSTGVVKMEINEDIAKHLFKYLVEIVLCDHDFDARESKLVKDVADVFGYSKEQQDQILQPVAATVMVKQALFPKKCG